MDLKLWVFRDGGRAAASFKVTAGDCDGGADWQCVVAIPPSH
jgi:hypothetical protein